MLSLFLALFYTPPRFYTNSNSLEREKVLSRKDPLVISGGVKQGAFNIRILHLLLEERQPTSQTFHFLFQAEISNKRTSNEQKLGRSGGWVSIFFTVQANRGPHIKQTPSMWVDTMQVEPQFFPKIYCKISLHAFSRHRCLADSGADITPFCCTKPVISGHFKGFYL